MLTIYGVYRSRAARNYWMAGELGIPFKAVPVIQLWRADPDAKEALLNTQSPEFLAVNPMGLIPSSTMTGSFYVNRLPSTYISPASMGVHLPSKLFRRMG